MRRVIISPKRPLQEILPEKDEDVLLVRDGHAVALIMSFDDDDLEWYARERDPTFIESIRRAREQAAKGQTVKHEELMAELDRRDAK